MRRRLLLVGMAVAVPLTLSCSDDNTTHDPLPTADQYVLAALNEAHTGDLGGLTGADALCTSQAAAAGRKETFKAFLSTKAFDVRDLVPSAAASGVPCINTRGEVLSESWGGLMENGSWSGAYLYTFDGKRVDESAGVEPSWVDADGWHGSLVGGLASPELTCRNWKSDNPVDRGAAGEMDMRRLLGQESHPCNTTLAVVCVGALVLPTYGPCTTPGTVCTATDPCAIDPTCGADGLCHAKGLMQCQDELTCTEDTCDGQGGCLFKVKTGECLIGGQCYKQGDPDPSGCASCDPSTSQEDWTPLADACMAGGKCYKKGDFDPTTGCNVCDPGQGTDGWTPRTDDHCKIGGKCYSSGDKHPDGCAVCDPTQSVVAWTASGNDCLIDGQCVAPGVTDPTGCNTCDPTVSKTGWSPVKGTICKIDGKCYKPGDKHPDGCAECDPTVTGLAWTPKGTDCLISNKCYAAGSKDPSGCNICDAAQDPTAWSPITAPLCKIGSQCYAKGDMHPQGCASCDPAASATGWTVVTNDCLIDDTCYQSGAAKPTGCGICDPLQSKTSWSPLAGCFDIVLVALNEAHTGNLGGIAGADALCAAQATGAGFKGTYKAFLSGTGRDVKDLITGNAASFIVMNSKGEQLFSSWSQMFTSSSWSSGKFIYSFDGKKVDENTGASPDWYDAQNWTGSVAAGTINTSSNCQSWTSDASIDSGASGELDMYKLVSGYSQACSQTLAVVCVMTAP